MKPPKGNVTAKEAHMPAQSPGYLDFASQGNDAEMQVVSRNIAGRYPGYHFGHYRLVGRKRLSAPNDAGYFYIMQPGGHASARIIDGPLTIDRGHYLNTALDQGDLIHLPPGATAEMDGDTWFWMFAIKGPPEHFIYKPGITLLRFCTNTKGGCNIPGAAPNPRRDFRKMLFSGHDSVVRVPDGFVPRLELHVPLINATSSRPHWHPDQSLKDGLPQHEMYLMLDHAPYGLEVDHVPPKLRTYSNPLNAKEFDDWDMLPGQTYSIFTRTGHQLYGGLVVVAAFPARFDLDNEIELGSPPAP
jgi:hypothetical protein